jgi:hypothetical protein
MNDKETSEVCDMCKKTVAVVVTNKLYWWLTPLQVLGFVAAGIGLPVCLYYATVILFLL